MEEENLHEEHKSHKGISHVKKGEHGKGFTHRIRGNPWVLSTLVLGVVLLALLVFSLVSSGSISEKQAEEKMLAFVRAQTGGDGEVLNVSSFDNNFYEITISLQGQEIPTYMTKDGKYFVPSFTPLVVSDGGEDEVAPVEMNKSDKPKVELYVFSYCPYGTQSEKGIIPVVKLLGDKIDFKIRQIGAMHGEYEKIEAQRQLCVEKEYPAKFLDYVLQFASSSEIGSCSGDATCVAPKLSALYTKLGMSKTKIDACMKTNGESLYAAEEDNARSQGVSGSPTLIINGQTVQSARDSASYLKTICGAFNTPPAECEQVLSSAAPSPGFGNSTSSGSAAQCN